MQTPLFREKLTLRLPPELHRSLRVVAVENGRSLNAEIVQRLSRSFDGGVRSDNENGGDRYLHIDHIKEEK